MSEFVVNHLKADLSAVFALARRYGKLKSNPVADVEGFSAPAGKKRTILQLDELRTLLEHIKGHRFEAYLRTAIFTGARQGELQALTWADINLGTGVITIDKALGKKKTGFGIKDPKNESSIRSINVDSVTLEALKALRATQSKAGFGERVFRLERGGQVNKDNFRKIFAEVIKAAGVSTVQFKELRHTMNSQMLAARVPVSTVQARMGHSTPVMTMGTYKGFIRGEQNSALTTFVQLLDGGPLEDGAQQDGTV